MNLEESELFSSELAKTNKQKKTVLIKSVYELEFNEVANLLKQAGYDATLCK